jgi:hypothetical protein
MIDIGKQGDVELQIIQGGSMSDGVGSQDVSI